MSGAGLPRRELAAVAAALLLPIPLLAASGLRIPLPGAIERGLASLTPGGGFDVAVVEAAAPARPVTAAAAPSGAEPTATASPSDSHAVSSAGVAPGAGAASVRGEEREDTTPDETDSPSPPTPHTDDQTPGGGESNPDVDSVRPPVETVVAAAVIDADAAEASAQVAVTDSGVEVDTGEDADLGPPLEVPLAPTTLPLP